MRSSTKVVHNVVISNHRSFDFEEEGCFVQGDPDHTKFSFFVGNKGSTKSILHKDRPKYVQYYGDLDKDQVKKRHTFMSEDGMYLYFVGIIDYLQEYNWKKKGENYFKGF